MGRKVCVLSLIGLMVSVNSFAGFRTDDLTATDTLTVTTSSGLIYTDTGLLTIKQMADDQVLIADDVTTASARTITNCTGANEALRYTQATNSFSCGSITATNGWSDGGTDITLSTSTDNVGIGGASLGKLSVDGDTDEPQLVVQGHSTQTSNIFVVENSAGTDRLSVANDGTLTISGTATPGMTVGDASTATFVVSSSLSGATDPTLTFGNALITASSDLAVSDEAYDATGWNASTEVPTKNAVRDKIESLSAGSGSKVVYLSPKSAKVSGAYVTSTPSGLDAASQGAQIDGGNGNWRLLFDDSTDEAAVWDLVIPDNYTSTPVVKIIYSMASGTASEVEWEAAIMCVTPGDAADIGTASFAAGATATETVPGTAGHTDTLVSITPTDDTCAAGDLAYVYISTDANDGTNDDSTGDRELVGAYLSYT